MRWPRVDRAWSRCAGCEAAASVSASRGRAETPARSRGRHGRRPTCPQGARGPLHSRYRRICNVSVTTSCQFCVGGGVERSAASAAVRPCRWSPRFGLRSSIPAMARFSVDFLGCKVSHVDVHGIRERLLADGHVESAVGEAGDVAVISTCCVTNEAVAKSRKAAARAARTHGRVYVTGCAANLAESAFASLPPNVTVVARRAEETAAFVAGDVGAIGCVQADARLDRVRAF